MATNVGCAAEAFFVIVVRDCADAARNASLSEIPQAPCRLFTSRLFCASHDARPSSL